MTEKEFKDEINSVFKTKIDGINGAIFLFENKAHALGSESVLVNGCANVLAKIALNSDRDYMESFAIICELIEEAMENLNEK